MNLQNVSLLTLAWALLIPAVLGLSQLFGLRLPERLTQRLAVVHSMGLLAGALGLVLLFLQEPARLVEVGTPPLLVTNGYEWRVVLLIDRLSVTYLALVALIYPVIVRFSQPSFHREPGSQRYWFLVTLLAFALTAVTLAGNIDVLYLGWELVGVSSVMLIAFFRRNPRSYQNSLRALIYYRVCDLGLLGAAMWIHHALPTPEFSHFAENAAVPTAAGVALVLLFATLAKSAQLPMSPWLHRAMEGPASSSAIFYGALSVHLGPLLLLRTSALWMAHPGVRVAMAGVGLLTALFATLVGHTRPDAKTSLAYATMAQLGLLYVEISLGWHTLALVHLCAHAGLRTWQFLRSSSLIQDFQDNPLVGTDVRLRRRSNWERLLPVGVRQSLYLAASRLFWLDSFQWSFIARPVLGFFSRIATLEDRLLGSTPAQRKS
ncbi:proton-conducting transporter membrane subunit [Stigmatella sp. ncwal1]|uniref:Proton-conducting transporter membrane subunit n=1 Tax=Stigmatella ashevillensis TaxID=2995309 RepID=A0ABT5D2E9_9BACT|nr:proton-conducting transporter membrane subunit [Stigmatella ashevillena]MDC0707839.1 proton-conducting transporter membrane subunit [Stigmatella ashevillena]